MGILHTTQRIGAAAAVSVTLAREAQRLDSWKEIAAYFGRSTRCGQRWESNCRSTVMNIQGEAAYLLSGRNWMRDDERKRSKAFPLGHYELDVVKDRVTSPTKREDVGSNPTWPKNFTCHKACEAAGQ